MSWPADQLSGIDRPSWPGIYVAGNVADPQAQVVTSAAAGLMAGAAANMDLAAEDARHAVTMAR